MGYDGRGNGYSHGVEREGLSCADKEAMPGKVFRSIFQLSKLGVSGSCSSESRYRVSREYQLKGHSRLNIR